MADRNLQVPAALVQDSHLITEDELAGLLVEHGSQLGATDTVLYLADYDQRLLVPVPRPGRSTLVPLPIDGTIAGRSYRAVSVQHGTADGGTRRSWVPVIDGTDRLGVLELVFDEARDLAVVPEIHAFAGAVAQLVMTKGAYGDLFKQVRRSQPMSLAAELLWQLLPPLTFGSPRVIITAALAPTHNVGGDAFDYAVNGDVARFAIFDAMGHGLSAGLMATIAVAAYRNARRAGSTLTSTVAAIDEAIVTYVGDQHYVTGVVGELDLSGGRLRWCTAGHPRPLILRQGRVVKSLEEPVSVPFGLGTRPAEGQEVLEPGDRVLLYTDGIVDVRAPNGHISGIDSFVDLISRASSEQVLPPETMRRLMHAVLDHELGSLRDDATALIVQWPGHGAEHLTAEA